MSSQITERVRRFFFSRVREKKPYAPPTNDHLPPLSLFLNPSDRDELLSFPQPLPGLRPVDVEEVLRPYCEKLVNNHRNTGHLTTLLLHATRTLQSVNHQTTQAGCVLVRTSLPRAWPCVT